MKSSPKLLACGFAACCLAAFLSQPLPADAAQAQTAAAQAQAGRSPVPAHRLYYFFFEHIARQEEAAAEADRAGRSGDAIRVYYKKRIGLADSDEATLRRIALACRAAVQKQDQAAKKVIDSFRARVAAAHPGPGDVLPSAPRELETLQAQRDEIILTHVGQLRTSMSTPGFQKVDAFIGNQFARNVTSRAVGAAVRDRPREGVLRR